MFEESRINAAYQSAERLEIDDTTKLVIISDCHRGIGSGADNFGPNQLLFYHALESYYQQGFQYIELGDGDELWQNRRMDDIKQEYDRVFELMAQMYRDGKLIMIYGNHDVIKRKQSWCRQNLTKMHAHNCKKESPLFPDISVKQAVVLTQKETGNEFLVLHGHQADFFNDRLYRLSKFLVRHIWRPLQLIGIKDPSSTTINPRKKDKVEKILMGWCEKNKKAIVAGHTHRAIFPQPGETPYFNDGCCVHPRYITAIEICQGEIAVVKWEVEVCKDGILNVNKDCLRPPQKISSYFNL